MLIQKLRKSSIDSTFWSFLQIFGILFLKLLITIILARLIEPEAFGKIAILSVFINIPIIFVESGFGKAIIQSKNINNDQLASIFGFNLVVSLFFSFLLYFFSPYIALFFKFPEFVEILRFLSIGVFFSSFWLVQSALLTKKLQFKTRFIIYFSVEMLTGIIVIVLALKGYGIWSLVYQSILIHFFRSLILWYNGYWKSPKIKFDFNIIKKYFDFGSKYLLSSLINEAFSGIYNAIIGKFSSPSQLAYYSKAKHLSELSIKSSTKVIGAVSFPVFSMIDDPMIFNKGLSRYYRTIVFFVFPISGLVFCSANELVNILLSEKWNDVSDLLKYFCVALLFLPFTELNKSIINSLGKSILFLKLELINKFLLLLNLFMFFYFGVKFLIIGIAIINLIIFYISCNYINKIIKYKYRSEARLIVFNLFSIFLISITTSIISHYFVNDYLVLLLKICLFISLYFSLIYSRYHEDLRYYKKIIKDYINN